MIVLTKSEMAATIMECRASGMFGKFEQFGENVFKVSLESGETLLIQNKRNKWYVLLMGQFLESADENLENALRLVFAD